MHFSYVPTKRELMNKSHLWLVLTTLCNKHAKKKDKIVFCILLSRHQIAVIMYVFIKNISYVWPKTQQKMSIFWTFCLIIFLNFVNTQSTKNLNKTIEIAKIVTTHLRPVGRIVIIRIWDLRPTTSCIWNKKGSLWSWFGKGVLKSFLSPPETLLFQWIPAWGFRVPGDWVLKG